MEQRKFLVNGEMIIKTEEGVFFHAGQEDFIPILIDEDEGKKLFEQAKEKQ